MLPAVWLQRHQRVLLPINHEKHVLAKGGARLNVRV